MAALTLLLMVSDVNRKSKVESLKGFRVFAKSENRDGQIRDLNAAPSSDNHENNRENFVIGHDHHLPLYGRGKSQAPSYSFLPGTRGSIAIISQRYVRVKLCFVMTVISPITERWSFLICPSFA